MRDYVSILKEELIEQFRGKPNIDALNTVIGIELQAVYDFYNQLRTERGLHTAIGKQLDGVGDIVALSRTEVGQYIPEDSLYDTLDDETYRQYLIYKALENTCNCTYPDIIKAFRMFWDRPIYYSEDPEQPATMIFDTGLMEGPVDTRPLMRMPSIRAAGVTMKMAARTTVPIELKPLYVGGTRGIDVIETDMPSV